jgi:2'-5' RNA ligase
VAKERLKSPRARLFVALDLPQDVRTGVVDWQQTALADPALRVVRPEALHITLVFLGYQAEKDVKAIAKAAFATDAEAPAVELLTEPVGVPPGKRPRLIALRTPPHPLPEHMFRFFRPTRLVLFRSHLRRTGAEYEPMAELELPTAHDDQETER